MGHSTSPLLAVWTRILIELYAASVGVPVELLNPDDVAQRWPHLATERLVGATWCPTDGFLCCALGGIRLPRRIRRSARQTAQHAHRVTARTDCRTAQWGAMMEKS